MGELLANLHQIEELGTRITREVRLLDVVGHLEGTLVFYLEGGTFAAVTGKCDMLQGIKNGLIHKSLAEIQQLYPTIYNACIKAKSTNRVVRTMAAESGWSFSIKAIPLPYNNLGCIIQTN